MKDSDHIYLYLSGRIRVLQRTVLPWEVIVHMAEAATPEEAERLARTGGVLPQEGTDPNGELEMAKARLFETLSVGESRAVVDLFRFPYDCHNAKVLLKGSLSGQETEALLSPCASVAAEEMKAAIEEEKSAALPAWLREGVQAARRAWMESRSAQLLDLALERALFAACRQAAQKGGSGAAVDYVRLWIDGVNLQTLLRMQQAQPEAVAELLFEGGGSSVGRLMECRGAGNLAAAFAQPALRAAAESGAPEQAERAAKRVLGAFAARCDAAAWGAPVLLSFLLRLELRQAAVRLTLQKRSGRGAALRTEVEECYG